VTSDKLRKIISAEAEIIKKSKREKRYTWVCLKAKIVDFLLTQNNQPNILIWLIVLYCFYFALAKYP